VKSVSPHLRHDKTAGYTGTPEPVAGSGLRGPFLPEDTSASNLMVDADFSAAQAAELLFRPIRARAVKRIRLLMFDPFDFETLMQVVP
jgi:hypothetical protein